MFIDTGDTFISIEIQQKIINMINSDPHVNIWNFPYFHYEKLTKEDDNRLHGKVYKRSFLQQYNMTFPYIYLDEDIGFNRSCRLCTDMIYIPLPVINQIKDPNSLTQKDNNIYMYRDQTRSLSIATLHTIDICRKNNINPQEEIHYIAVALYYWFLRTAAECPLYLQEAWHGAKIFFDSLKSEIKPNELITGNVYLKRCLQYRDKISFPINILRFTYDIQNNEIIPNKYFTLS